MYNGWYCLERGVAYIKITDRDRGVLSALGRVKECTE